MFQTVDQLSHHVDPKVGDVPDQYLPAECLHNPSCLIQVLVPGKSSESVDKVSRRKVTLPQSVLT